MSDDRFLSVPIRQHCNVCRLNEVLYYPEQPETIRCAPCAASLVREAAALFRAALELECATRIAALAKKTASAMH